MLIDEHLPVRKIRIIRFVLIAMMVIIIYAVVIAMRRTELKSTMLLSASLPALVAIYLANRLAHIRCPRCGEYFHSVTDKPSARLWSSRCRHCRLPLRGTKVIYPSME